MKKSVGYNLDYTPEKPETTDAKCPYYGEVSVRGKLFEGVVVSDSMTRTVKVEWDTLVRDKKYNRYFKKRTRVTAHNSDAVAAKVGDKVVVGETRPLSKTKHFAVVKVIEQ